jgi:hypothetical protein
MSTNANDIVKVDGKVCPVCGTKVSTYPTSGSHVNTSKLFWEEIYESLIYENDPACEQEGFDND